MKLKNKKLSIGIVIGLMCMILVSIILMRFKVVEETDIEGQKIIREAEIRKEISAVKGKYDELTKSLEDINQKKIEYKNQIEKNEDTTDLIEKELKQTNELIGKTSVRGEGIIVTLTDTTDEKILASDLSELMNELKYAGAEAISINGIRILPMTDVTEATNDLMLINGQKITSPYEVKAIGSQVYLYSTLSAKNGFVDYYTKRYNLDIKIEKQKNIIVESTDQDIEFKYMKEGEE